MTKNNFQSFINLHPDSVMDAASAAGFLPTGEFTQLNSYENRVFDLKLETSEQNVIAKFYRPGRWSKNTILEEHEFLIDLDRSEIPAVKPIVLKNKSTLIEHEGLYAAFFPKIKGRLPDELLPKHLEEIGRLMARVHIVGAEKQAQHRQVLHTESNYGWPTLDFLQDRIAPEVVDRYNDAVSEILVQAEERLDLSAYQRIHGDCHRGNLLLNPSFEKGVLVNPFFLVDFDDFVSGPVVQDLWMLLSGDVEAAENEIASFLKGYNTLSKFPENQLHWIPCLRGMRILMYSGWIANRWSDPSFPKLFPEFGTYTYWAKEVEALEKICYQLNN